MYQLDLLNLFIIRSYEPFLIHLFLIFFCYTVAMHQVTRSNSSISCYCFRGEDVCPKSKLLAVALIIAGIVLGGMGVFGGIGYFASYSTLPPGLMHAIGTKGCLLMLTIGGVAGTFCGIGSIVLLMMVHRKKVDSTARDGNDHSKHVDHTIPDENISDTHADNSDTDKNGDVTLNPVNVDQVDAIAGPVEDSSVNDRDHRGYTSLHTAAYNGQTEMVRELLQKGAAVDARNHVGQTPLHQAALGVSIEAIEALLVCHGAINAEDNNGNTPLHAALVSADKDHTKAIHVLLHNRASIDG